MRTLAPKQQNTAKEAAAVCHWARKSNAMCLRTVRLRVTDHYGYIDNAIRIE